MTFPTNPPLNAQDAARKLDVAAFTIYTETNAIKQDCIASSVGVHDLISSRLQSLIATLAIFNLEAAKSGVDAAYVIRFANKTFTFAAEVAAVALGVQAFIDFIRTTVPIDAVSSRWVLTQEFDIDNTLIQRVTTGPVPLAALQAQAQLVLDLFDIT